MKEAKAEAEEAVAAYAAEMEAEYQKNVNKVSACVVLHCIALCCGNNVWLLLFALLVAIYFIGFYRW